MVTRHGISKGSPLPGIGPELIPVPAPPRPGMVEGLLGLLPSPPWRPRASGKKPPDSWRCQTAAPAACPLLPWPPVAIAITTDLLFPVQPPGRCTPRFLGDTPLHPLPLFNPSCPPPLLLLVPVLQQAACSPRPVSPSSSRRCLSSCTSPSIETPSSWSVLPSPTLTPRVWHLQQSCRVKPSHSFF